MKLLLLVVALTAALDPLSYSQEEFASLYLMPLNPVEQAYQPFSDGSHPPTDHFDWRETDQADCIHPIRDQGACGSCWSFGTSEALSDRFCIHSNGAIKEEFSPQHLVNCVPESIASGCNGGETIDVIEWIGEHEITTDRCTPYIAPSLAQESQGRDECRTDSCSDDSFSWEENVYTVSNYTQYEEVSMQTLMAEIAHNGPIYMSMISTEEFKMYSGGVFASTPDDKDRGGHAVKIIGWGKIDEEGSEEPDNYYWIGANSWNVRWGDGGYFNIRCDQKIGYKAGANTPLIQTKHLLASQ